MVDLCLQNPCWDSESSKCSVSSGRMSLSRTLIAGLISNMGLYEVPRWGDFPALGIGTIVACFQIAGMLAERIERL